MPNSKASMTSSTIIGTSAPTASAHSGLARTVASTGSLSPYIFPSMVKRHVRIARSRTSCIRNLPSSSKALFATFVTVSVLVGRARTDQQREAYRYMAHCSVIRLRSTLRERPLLLDREMLRALFVDRSTYRLGAPLAWRYPDQ